jgi:FHS family L-fucose permease-like MFS transporter
MAIQKKTLWRGFAATAAVLLATTLAACSSGSIAGALKHKHLVWAIVAQLFYVGAQVCVTSFFVRMAISGGGVDEKTAGYYLGVYGLLFMAGRFIGTIIMRFIDAAKLLSIYSILCIVLSLVAMYADGKNVVLALGGLGFFMSIMFPTIFALSCKGLGDGSKLASSLIIMSIVGGALIPPLTASLFKISTVAALSIPLLCFTYIIYYAYKGFEIRD